MLEPTTAEAAAGIGDQMFDGPALDGGDQPVDSRFVGKIGLQRLDTGGAQSAQRFRRLFDFRLVGRDQQRHAVTGAAFGQLQANAAGSAGNHGKLAGMGGGLGHGMTPVRRWAS